MKIALIAGFSNPEVREHLKLKQNSKMFSFLLKWFHLPIRVGELRDYASWVVNMISDLEKRPDVELHVIVPHIRLKENVEEFQMRGVHYHFFSSEWTSFCRLVRNYVLWKKLQNSSRYTKRLLKKIQPDIVVLSGAENPAISVSYFGVANYPKICLCQTVYNDVDSMKFRQLNPLKQKLELDIFNHSEYIGVYCRKHFNMLRRNGYTGNVLKFNYPPMSKFIEPSDVAKQYDFVNFALNHSLSKGTHDSIRALAIVKQDYPNITLNIVGGCSEQLKNELNNLIDELGLKKNVVFTPFFERQSDLLLHVQKSRFAVLPCKHDNTSGTMSQSMFLGIPIVVYKTSGTPAFNFEKRCALIAEMNDIEGLADNMKTLLCNPEIANELKVNGRWYKENKAKKDKVNWDRMVRGFSAICESAKNKGKIPEEVLFNPETDD